MTLITVLNLIPGISDREFWMLIMMVVVAIFASVANYYLTKWGLDTHKVPLWKFRKPILFGVLAGIILWFITQSGNVSPLGGNPLSHEHAGMWAIAFGATSEKVVSLVINKSEGKLSDLLNKL